MASSASCSPGPTAPQGLSQAVLGRSVQGGTALGTTSPAAPELDSPWLLGFWLPVLPLSQDETCIPRAGRPLMVVGTCTLDVLSTALTVCPL